MHNLNQTQLKHRAAIGGVALVWTQLENDLQQILWRLAGLENKIGRCITQHMSFNSLKDAIITVAHESERFNAIAPELERLLKKTDQLRIKRNDILHALWGIIVGEGAPKIVNAGAGEVTGLVIKARGRLKITINHTTVDKINDIIEEILAHHTAIVEFVAKNIPKPAAEGGK